MILSGMYLCSEDRIMQDIEPFYNWRYIYVSEEDKHSPFYGRTYSEFEFSLTVYNYYIHPQWDDFGSRTLYLKVLLADYEEKYAIIEMIGEWNDAIENDIMELKREVLEKFMSKGIFKFILIGENVLNYHSDGKDYYMWTPYIKHVRGIILSTTPNYIADICGDTFLQGPRACP